MAGEGKEGFSIGAPHSSVPLPQPSPASGRAETARYTARSRKRERLRQITYGSATSAPITR